MKNKKIIISVLAVFMIVTIVINFLGLVRIDREKREWTIEQKEELLKRTKTEFMAQYPEFAEYSESVNDYINCTVRKLSEEYSYKEYYDISKMPEDKKLKIILPIIQTCTDSFLKHIEPYNEEIKFNQEIYACAKRAKETGKIDSVQAIEYCKCFLTYLRAKYGDIEKLNIDSIKVIESEQIKKCFIEATK